MAAAAARPGFRRMFSVSAFAPPKQPTTPPPKADPSPNLFVSAQVVTERVTGFSKVKMATHSPTAWVGGELGRHYGSGSAPEGRKGKVAPLQARGMVDRFRLRAKGGDGGNGCVSLRRSRSDRHGRPDGGNGGKGGDVILECSRSIWDFSGLQHHTKAGRGGNGVSKNQIGTRGFDKIAQVPIGTVIHLVQGEQPSVAVTKLTRALDPWDIPDATEHSSVSLNKPTRALDPWEISYAAEHFAASSNQMKDLDGGLFHQHVAPKDYTDGNGSGSKLEKRTYLNTCSKPELSNIDHDANNYPRQVEMDEKDQFEGDDKEFWEDEDEFDMDNEEEEVEEEREEQDQVQYSVAEMTKPGQRLIIARGGEGGLGNAFIIKEMRLSKENRQEEIARLSTGQPGTETLLILELKSIADVGLVGLPNAGKSTLLSALSRARPEIADYAFTTLRPNIGSLTYEDHFSVKVADIPGLIKGAHENRGLGHAFLRHIERTKVLAYVLDLAATLNGRKGVLPWEQLQDLVMELEHYQEGLTRRPSLIVANKIDEEGADGMFEELKRRVQGVPIFPVCAILQEGVPDLRVGLRKLMDDDLDPQGIDLSKIIVD
ncbi:probable GTP-binding protein OBGM, mitochondrial [Phragmites australis]|uniref:probable GTP-binding protein OBGM, mitochondrial n=1 Tax=Phragmites australis TaxID=29695 RepID=UPI002D78675A|nr:probable GTP-binding protein OBGM, mitochondrial [Phragmites australis]XP_062195633.1 probable GTP-binding protein OBGM, mitochondrial [Phragmites australis]XP_062195634.1 probable GTP-binding protein OBGM, mitochondrial [Phragmites australis]